MFKLLGKIDHTIEKKKDYISLKETKDGCKYYDEFIIFKKKEKIKIYNRLCDHRGGKLISKNGKSICPIHNWEFNPDTGLYNNSVKKKQINWSIKGSNIEIVRDELTPQIKKKKTDNKTKIRFINHAFLNIEGENFSFSTDPWAIGPSFNSGWWLKNKSKNDWLDKLNESSFIYISHNHPDHLHPLTLSKMNKNIQIVVPNFKSDSVGRYMEELGFKNVLRLEFNHEYHLENTDLIISIFKSGDFRDDSGIYFSNGNFTGLLGVDSNVINFERYPKVNLYASSFAGGASGYPLMFENYKLKEQINILNKDKLFLRSKNLNTLKKIQPNFYLPYAGFFQEKLSRDKRIMQYNNKNNIDDYKKFCDANKINLLNVETKDLYYFVGNKLIKSDFVQKPWAEDLSEKKYLKYFKDQYSKIDEKYIKNYFINSKFQDNLKLYVFITNDSFKKIEKVYLIDFSNEKIIFKILNKTHRLKIQNKTKLSKRILILKIRKESFLNTIYNKLPWEDIMIGFQCKILRNPNIYNVKFWHHFTNIYTHSKNVKSKTDCSSCISLTQFFDKEIYENNL